MTTIAIEVFYRTVLNRVGALAADKARPLIPSRVLQAALEFNLGPDPNSGQLEIPHYWAVYVHDDTRAFQPRTSKFLAWFPNPADDPRNQPNYPVRDTDIKTLRMVWTSIQFRAALAENRRRRAAGEEPFIVLAKSHGPRAGSFFFDPGLAGLGDEAAQTVLESFEEFLNTFVILSDKQEAKIQI